MGTEKTIGGLSRSLPRTSPPAQSRALDESFRRFGCRAYRPGYVLLETVVATGLLVVGLAVIGGQIQDSESAVHKMELKIRALTLAEQQLALMDLGLVELDSVDEVQEGDFGPRYPYWGWRIITEPTSLEETYRLTVEVLYYESDEPYQKDGFEYDLAEVMHTSWAFRRTPKPLDLALDFGLTDDEMLDFATKVDEAAIPCFEGGMFDVACLLETDIEELAGAFAALQELGIDLGAAGLTPEVMDMYKNLFGEEGEGGDGESESGTP